MHRASLWLASSNWQTKQQDIEAHLKPCLAADPEWSRPALLLGGMYTVLGDQRRAEEVYRRVLSANPAALDVADRLLGLLERQRRFAEARQVLDQLRVVDPQVMRGYRIRTAIVAGENSEAMEELELRVAGSQSDAGARIVLARLLHEKGRTEDAFKLLAEAEKITPDSMIPAMTKVALLRTAGRVAEARAVLDQEVPRRNTFQAYAFRAGFLASIKDLESAEKDYQRLTTFAEQAEEGYGLLAQFYIESGNVDKTIETLKKATQAYPDNQGLKNRLMRSLFTRGTKEDRELAEKMLAELEKRSPGNLDALACRALVLLEARTDESTRRAEGILQQIVRLQPTAVDAHMRLIGIAASRQDYAAARELAIRALGANPNNLRLLLARADAEWALNNTSMARQQVLTALQEEPNSIEARDFLINLALAGRDQKALGEAHELVKGAMVKEPDNDRLRTANAAILAARGQADTAIKELEAYRQTEKGRRSILIAIALADIHAARGEFDQAAKEIDRAAKLSPDSPAVARARLRLLWMNKQFEQFAKVASSLPATRPSDTDMILYAAAFLGSSESASDRKRAIALYERAYAISPQLLPVQLGIAVLSYQTGDVERAEKLYREVRKNFPKNTQAMNDLAWILSEKHHRYQEALDLANTGLSLAPDYLDLRDTRGVILQHLGKFEDARRDFERCIDLAPPDSPARARAEFQLGRTFAKLKNAGKTKEHLEEALKIDKKRPSLTPEERDEIKKLIVSTGGQKG
jgi:tetratricopeptide (TPR) repeat protein